jgi:hypothetical protein
VANLPPPAVELRCAECGAAFEMSYRRASEHRRLGTTPSCRACRHAVTPSREAIAEAREWWLAHFTLDELRAWPPL